METARHHRWPPNPLKLRAVGRGPGWHDMCECPVVNAGITGAPSNRKEKTMRGTLVFASVMLFAATAHGWTYNVSKAPLKGVTGLPAVKKILTTLQPLSTTGRRGTFIFKSQGQRYWRAQVKGVNKYLITEFGPKKIRHFHINQHGLRKVEVGRRGGGGLQSYAPGLYTKLTGQSYLEWTTRLSAEPKGNPLQMLRQFKRLYKIQ